MGYRDDYEGMQHGQSGYVNLPVVMTYTTKQNAVGKPCFMYYDREKKQNVFTEKPIVGMLANSDAMVISAYSPNLGKNGGNYQSTYYKKKSDKIIIFANGKIEKKGNLEEVELFLKQRTQSVKKQRVLVVITVEGIVEIRTHLGIMIGIVNGIKSVSGNMVFLGSTVKLTPELYSPSHPKISKKGHESMSKLALKNPPCFVGIDLYKPVGPEAEKALDLDKNMAHVRKWSDYLGTLSNSGNDAGSSTVHHNPPPSDLFHDGNGYDDDAANAVNDGDLPF